MLRIKCHKTCKLVLHTSADEVYYRGVFFELILFVVVVRAAEQVAVNTPTR